MRLVREIDPVEVSAGIWLSQAPTAKNCRSGFKLRRGGQVRWVIACILLLSFGTLLAGCGSQRADPSSPTPAASQTEEGVGESIQIAGPPPANEKDALAAANTIIEADDAAFFRVLQKKIPPEALDEIEGGSYRGQNADFLEGALTDPAVSGVSGQPDLWTPDLAKSSASPLKVGGKTYRYGLVKVVGCFYVRWDFVYASGAVEPLPKSGFGQSFANEVIVQYEPLKRIWLITDENDLTYKLGAPECK